MMSNVTKWSVFQNPVTFIYLHVYQQTLVLSVHVYIQNNSVTYEMAS